MPDQLTDQELLEFGDHPDVAPKLTAAEKVRLGRLRASKTPPTEEPTSVLGLAGDVATGAVKGVGSTIFGLGKAVRDYTPIGRISDAIYPGAFDQRPPEINPSNTAQRVGYAGEQIAEFLLPTGAAGKAGKVAEVAKSGLLAKVQGGTNTQAGVSAGLSAVIPGAAAAKKASKYIGSKAVPLVRAAIKPTVTEMRQQAGASRNGISQAANRLAKFIIDNKLTSPEKAQAIIDDAEQQIAKLVTNTPTDAPARAARYLKALERSAAKQGLPADDVAAIRTAAKELVDASPMGETVTKTVMKPSPSGLVDAHGKPVMVATKQTSRALRAEMPADEALETARGSSRWGTRKAWGEQKGATTEAKKAVERGARDAVKKAIPETKPVLKREGQAIQAKRVLDRKAFREGNRDAVSLPAHVIAAGEIARGKVPVLAFAANWLRNNQLKAGIYAKQLATAIDQKNVPRALEIMKKVGVGAEAVLAQ